MAEKLGIGIVGCGDYLRWQVPGLKHSSQVAVRALFDTDRARADKYAGELGGNVCDSVDSLIKQQGVDIVCLFVPPWVRRELFEKAAGAGKHVLATKPLAASVDDCAAIVGLVDGGIRCGVMYGRTGNAMVETYRLAFESGEIGRLALYKQDWIHHYPQWNSWATDPEKNGGPFMDAMIHNLNTARYLMGRPATHVTLHSDNHAQALKCSDTEFMKLDFEQNGSAHLFITWAADLEVQSTEGNYREHIDQKFMVTDERWFVTERKGEVVARRDGQEKTFKAVGGKAGPFDRFAEAVTTGGPLPRDFASAREAYEDIRLIRDAEASAGNRIKVDLALQAASVVA